MKSKHNRPTYHIISHTHWDREWYLSFEEFRSMLVNLVDDLIELFQKNPEYRCFTLDGQIIILEDYLNVRPEQEKVLRKLVEERKLFIGPWYVLADELLVSGEATIRNLLLGHRIGERFGGSMQVGYLPDTFSHIAMMPAILQGFNINNVILWRGFGGEPGQESSEYYWTGHDGTRILMTHLSKFGYSAGYFKSAGRERVNEIRKRVTAELHKRAQTNQRLWFNGGDHHWPDPAVPEAIRIMQDQDRKSIYKHSNLEDYTIALRSEAGNLPVVNGELRFGFRQAFAVQGGIYSSNMYIKQANFACQQLLERYVEPVHALYVSEGLRSQLPLIRKAWKLLLQNHPHDSICATSIDSVHKEMMIRFKRVKEIAKAVQRFCWDELLPYSYDDYKDDTYVFVINMQPQVRSDVVYATVDFYLKDIVVGLNPDVKVAPKKSPVKSFTLLDPSGNEIPYEILHREEAFGITYSKYDYPHQTLVDRFSVRFYAEDVPSFGYKGYKLVKKKRSKSLSAKIKKGKNYIENDLVRLDVSSRGELTLLDKRNDRIYKKLHVFEDSGDIGDEYNYCPPDKDIVVFSNQFKPKITIDKTPFDASITLEYAMKLPESASAGRRSRAKNYVTNHIRSVVSLRPESARIDITTTVSNRAKDHRFRVTFASGVQGNVSYADTPFAIVERKHQRYNYKDFPIEVPPTCAPMHRFMCIKNANKGLAIMALGLPEYDLILDKKGTVAITLLRSVGSISHGDLKTRRGGEAAWKNMTPGAQCLGTYTFNYAVYPLDEDDHGEWSSIFKIVDDYTTPLYTISRKNQDALPTERSWLQADFSGCMISALKEGEEQDGIVLRWYNPDDIAKKVRIHQQFAQKNVQKVNLNELPYEDIQSDNEGAVSLQTDARSIATIKFVK